MRPCLRLCMDAPVTGTTTWSSALLPWRHVDALATKGPPKGIVD